MAIKVALRQKDISRGRRTLYLDFYPAIPHPESGKLTRREGLKMYIFIDKKELKRKIDDLEDAGEDASKLKIQYRELNHLTPIEKRHNEEMLKIALSIRQKRENMLNKPEIYSEQEKEQLRQKELGEQDFIKYFEELADKKNDSNRSNWLSTLNYLKAFSGGRLKFSELNEKRLNEFKEYLLSVKSVKSNKVTLSQNSALSYFNKVKAALSQAHQDGILQTDLNARIKPIKEAETRREHLTREELKRLANTHCNDELLKRAALFSALTGLRFSDIKKMTWAELQHIENQGYIINFTQQKTQGVENHPISDQAYSLLGEAKSPEDKVFPELKYSAYHNKHLYQWIGAAGITRNITFHSFRHTYAVLQILAGTDIFAVMKMMGHKDLKTTLIYAKIVDETKRKAANSINIDI